MDENLQEVFAYGAVIAGSAETLLLDEPDLGVVAAVMKAAMRSARGVGANLAHIAGGATAALRASQLTSGCSAQATLEHARSLCDRAADVKANGPLVTWLRAAVARDLERLACERGR
jgi:hypothetical protein